MMADEILAADALSRERIQSARRVNRLRVCGVSAFFAVSLMLGGACVC